MESETSKTGAEKVVWDLSDLYKGVDDPQITKDVETLAVMAKQFHTNYKGKLSEKLGDAIREYAEIEMLTGKVELYLYLCFSRDVSNAEIKAKKAEVEKSINQIKGKYLVFLDTELACIDDDVFVQLCRNDPVVARHQPWVERKRKEKPHLLSEPVESALVKRSSFGIPAWSEFFHELEAGLEFTFGDKTCSLNEMLHLWYTSKNAEERFELMSIINSGLGGTFAKYSAQTLYVVTGLGAVENTERSHPHPMNERNMSNLVTDDMVNTLHKVVETTATVFTKRFYRLKAAHLGLETLRWSDRNAPMPFSDTTIVPFDESFRMVHRAYGSFSPTLAGLVEKFVKDKRIDACIMKNKRNGAFNYSVVLPGNIPRSYIFMSYRGSGRDTMTLAHELGHAVNGMLAGETQGTLMSEAPISFAETASIFGEMTTYNFIRDTLLEKGENVSLLALTMETIDDIINTVVRQIGFSNFERRIHGIDPTYSTWGKPTKLSVEEVTDIWLETLQAMYGKDGEVFTYENTENLWTYIPHFHRPFYVYGYGFGQLLTSSLYAKQPFFADAFEPLYLDFLRSGSTKNVMQLLQPFSLDPTDKQFWEGGVNAGLGRLLEEAERLSAEMGVFV